MSDERLSKPEERFVRRALAFRAALRDPALPGFVLMFALIVAGFAVMAFAWNGAARTIYVPLQFPRVVSGGLGGLALIGVGVALFDLQGARRDSAEERRLQDDLLDEVAEISALGPKLRRVVERRRGMNSRTR